ncbi:MAG: branched-chain amino acid ABC transporter permease [Betaproteobacteria bacterium]|jgi:branched-chain amino acid transport system permease protein
MTDASLTLQVLLNGLLLGALYACIATGFSLVWGVLNVINMLHGSLIVLAGYLTCRLWATAHIHPLAAMLPVATGLFLLGAAIQGLLINRVVQRPVLATLTLTFGLDMILYNAMNAAFEATPQRVTLDLGRLEFAGVVLPVDRVAAMALALGLAGLLYAVLRGSRIGRAIVAVRMDREAACLMGIRVPRIYALTFGLGAFMAGACGCLLAVVYPVTTSATGQLLGKAFIVCVVGGLGTVPGALVGGLALGVTESFGGHWFGPQAAALLGFALMIALLAARPTGLLGRKGFE